MTNGEFNEIWRAVNSLAGELRVCLGDSASRILTDTCMFRLRNRLRSRIVSDASNTGSLDRKAYERIVRLVRRYGDYCCNFEIVGVDERDRARAAMGNRLKAVREELRKHIVK